MTYPVTTAPQQSADTLAVLVIETVGTLRDDVMSAGHTLARLYELIGCRGVDVVRLDEHLDMWLDDEGMFSGEINMPATFLAQTFGFTHQPYFGTVVLTGGADANGNIVALLPGTAAAVRAHLD